ncbi:MAG TPA: hypothetical protein VK700_06540 [Steroidobacteraceae bacterium]|jgi:hypothetical protein|nr:hypothetical protein [Steroidobacteraceae bacterium]
MNETDLIRQQLRLERTHLREILRALGPPTASERPAHPVAVYIDWAGRRLIEQLLAHQTALQQAAALDPALQGALAAASSAARQAHNGAATAAHLPAQDLLAALDAWSEPLDAAAARALRIAHWRLAARLNADTILEERQLYAAARAAVVRR